MSERPWDSDFDTPLPLHSQSRWRRWGRMAIVCLVPLALITGVLWQPVMQAREASHRSSCKCFLKQFGLALHSHHDQGCHFLLGDGTVRFLRHDLPQATVDAIFTRNGGEAVFDF